MFPFVLASVSKLDSQPRMPLSFDMFKIPLRRCYVCGVVSSLIYTWMTLRLLDIDLLPKSTRNT